MDTETMRNVAQQVYDKNQTSDQFAVSQTPFHTHNNSDSPKISYMNLLNRVQLVNIILPGVQGQTTGNWGVVFTVPFALTIVGATEIHQTAEATATTMTVQIEKLTGTTASGAGTNLLTTGFNLKGTANTLQTATLDQTSAKTVTNSFNFSPGDRLGLVLSTTGSAPADVIGVNIVIQLSY